MFRKFYRYEINLLLLAVFIGCFSLFAKCRSVSGSAGSFGDVFEALLRATVCQHPLLRVGLFFFSVFLLYRWFRLLKNKKRTREQTNRIKKPGEVSRHLCLFLLFDKDIFCFSEKAKSFPSSFATDSGSFHSSKRCPEITN